MELDMVSFQNPDFAEKMAETVQNLFNDSEHCDVTLACGKIGRINAHRFLLSSASPVFKKILAASPEYSPLIFLGGFQFEDLAALVKFIYLGEVQVPASNLDRFFSAAKDLEIKGLGDPSEEPKYLSNPMSTELKPKLFPPRSKVQNKLATDDSKILEYINFRTEVIETKSNIDGSSTQKDCGNFLCGQCDSSFATKATLQHHINSQHLRITFTCETCNDFVTNKATALRKHKATEHGEVNVLLSCQQCDFKSAKASKIREHILNVHEGARYPCIHCSYLANSIGNLQSHTKSQHEGIRYPCDLCDHKSTRKQYLKKHKEKIHKLV